MMFMICIAKFGGAFCGAASLSTSQLFRAGGV
jgi:hypothetical protein